MYMFVGVYKFLYKFQIDLNETDFSVHVRPTSQAETLWTKRVDTKVAQKSVLTLLY